VKSFRIPNPELYSIYNGLWMPVADFLKRPNGMFEFGTRAQELRALDDEEKPIPLMLQEFFAKLLYHARTGISNYRRTVKNERNLTRSLQLRSSDRVIVPSPTER
jgi:hypothetical protein